MALSEGQKLGPYEIVARIGAGGMGEVYKARDTRLDRLVAIKVSSREFTDRFQREAHAIASLNHPNICTLYDVGPDYLVMEFIEGTPLKGPLPVHEALRIGIQIAEAVSHAHRHGVIHRDLKPGNILVTKSGVKVLDFGLAKFRRAAADPDGTVAATLTMDGAVIGTPQYMAPEQLEGREADERTDVFAFGLVLYEMLTGRPAFEGKTQASLIASIMASEPPPVTKYQPLAPPALEHLIRTCLAKDREDRRQNMQDVLLDLRWVAESGSQTGALKPVVQSRKGRERLSWVIAGVALAVAVALAVVHFREKPPETFPVRFEQPAPPQTFVMWFDTLAVSPDGRNFVSTSTGAGRKPSLWLHRLDSFENSVLTATDPGSIPFWSPDSRQVAYFDQGKLKKVDLDGGTARVVCDLPPSSSGGSWNRDGLILIGTSNGVISQVSAAGGELKPLLALDEARKERSQRDPHFLPDGRHFLYTSISAEPNKGGIFLSSTDKKESRLLIAAQSNASYAAGFVLFARGTTVMAQAFDPGRLQLRGEAFRVAEPVGRSTLTQAALFSISQNGVLVYRPPASVSLELVWADRKGKKLQTLGEPRPYIQGMLSPDEQRFAVQVSDTLTGTADVWLVDLATHIFSRFTSDKSIESTPIWSPDGREIVFASDRNGIPTLYRKVVGGGEEQLILPTAEPNYPGQFLKDGSILFMDWLGGSFCRLHPGPDAKPEMLLKTEYARDAPRVSPDGRWIAYYADESGRAEVYVATFPAFNERRQVSNNGGVQPAWCKDGRELFYLALDGTMMSVPVKPGPPLETGVPQPLFPTRIPLRPTLDQFAVTGDGQRFLLIESRETDAPPFKIVLNWPALKN